LHYLLLDDINILWGEFMADFRHEVEAGKMLRARQHEEKIEKYRIEQQKLEENRRRNLQGWQEVFTVGKQVAEAANRRKLLARVAITGQIPRTGLGKLWAGTKYDTIARGWKIIQGEDSYSSNYSDHWSAGKDGIALSTDGQLFSTKGTSTYSSYSRLIRVESGRIRGLEEDSTRSKSLQDANNEAMHSQVRIALINFAVENALEIE
jgi:hypothetical protein